MKGKLKEDWITANKHHVSIQTVTKSVHEEAIRIADEQMKYIDIQMRALDNFVTRARSLHSQSLKSLSETAKASDDSIGSQLATTHERSKNLGDDISEKQKQLDEALVTLESTLQQPISDLRANISRTTLQEYEPTGETPQRTRYEYPTELPRTEPHENLIATTGSLSPLAISPSKSAVFGDPIPDANDESVESRPLVTNFSASLPPGKLSQTLPGLREINVNVLGSSRNSTPEAGIASLCASVCADNTVQLLGRSVREPSSRKFVKKPSVVALEGKENAMPSQVQALSPSKGRRRVQELLDRCLSVVVYGIP